MSSTNGWLTMLRTEIKSERKMTNPDTLAQDYATARETAAFAEWAEAAAQIIENDPDRYSLLFGLTVPKIVRAIRALPTPNRKAGDANDTGDSIRSTRELHNSADRPDVTQPRSPDAVGGADHDEWELVEGPAWDKSPMTTDDFNAGRAHERAQVVAWLREKQFLLTIPKIKRSTYHTDFAAALQRGDHDDTPVPEDDGWRPISEAKKDGTPILVARRDKIFGWVRGWSRWVDVKGVAGWLSHGFFEVPGDLGLGDPTHFRELPQPPQEPSE